MPQVYERLSIPLRVEQWMDIMLACEHAAKRISKHGQSIADSLTGEQLVNIGERYEIIAREVDALLNAHGECRPIVTDGPGPNGADDL